MPETSSADSSSGGDDEDLALDAALTGKVLNKPDAPAPQGPWSPERLLVPSMQFPGGIYAPFLHPWSTGRELYYNVSLWSEYNVMLMRTVLP